MGKFKNKIFLIGGASGVTKSSLSFELMKKHKIIHKLGSGFVREMAKSFILKKNNKMFVISKNDPYICIYQKNNNYGLLKFK